MPHLPTSVMRGLTVVLTAALVSLICALTLAPAASARVVVIPGSVQGGGTETFAVRLANESDVPTTRLELAFPLDVAVPAVEIAPVDGWTARVTMRPVAPPVTVGDEQYGEVVESIVWEGGRVAPKQFEQFLVTAGPLPEDGRLVLAATQGYEDGTVDRWTEAGGPDGPGAPTIVLVPEGAVAPAEQPGEPAAGTDSAPAEEIPGAGTTEETGSAGPLLWLLLAAPVLIIPVVALVDRWNRGRRRRAAGPAHSAAGKRAGVR